MVVDALSPPRSADVEPLTSRERVCDAVIRCVARWGLAKTTIDDVAREADISRATLYRLFPGGRSEIIHEAGLREVTGLLRAVAAAMEAETTLVDALRTGLMWGAAAIDRHEALRRLLDHEPASILPLLCFDRLDALLAVATKELSPPLLRFLEPRDAAEICEWLTRIVLSYSLYPLRTDLSTRHDADALIAAHVLPATRAVVGTYLSSPAIPDNPSFPEGANT